MRRSVRGLIGLVVFLALWEAAGRTGLLDARYVPPPSGIATRIVGLFGQPEFVADFVATVLAWLIAMCIATAIAVPLGLLLGSVPVLQGATSTVVEFLRPIPSVTLIPLAFVVLGDGAQMKIALAAFTAMWPIMFNVVYGLHEVDPLFVDTAKAFRTGRLRTTTSVRLPYIAPFVLTGIRMSAAVSLIVIVSTEFLSNSGIGFGSYIVINGEQSGDIPLVIAGATIAGILGYLVNGVLQGVQNRWFAWAAEGGERE
jgi:NitT/TauT family transport system permease protein